MSDRDQNVPSSSAPDDALVRSLEEGECVEHSTTYNNHEHEEKIDNHRNQTTQPQERNQNPHKKNSTSDDDDEVGEDSSQYWIPVLHHGGGGGADSSFSSLGAGMARYALSSPPQAHHQPTDDESNQYFMSEPSLSEDGDSTARIRAPHQASNNFLLDVVFSADISDDNNPSVVEEVHRSGTFQSVSSEEDEIMAHPSRRNGAGAEDHHYHHPLVARGSGHGLDTPSGGSGNELPQFSPPNHQPHSQKRTPEQGRRRNRPSRLTPQLSPGNTSLSSWDSPAVNPKQVFLQFVMPENKYEKQARMQMQMQQQQQQRQKANQEMETEVQRPQHRIHRSQSNGSDDAGRYGKHNRDSGNFSDRRSFSSDYKMNREHQQQVRPMDGESARTMPAKSNPTVETTDAFLRDLRVHSHGALEQRHYLDSTTNDALTPVSAYGSEPTEVNAVMRRGQSRNAGVPLHHHRRRDVVLARAEEYDSVNGDLFSLPSAMVRRGDGGMPRDSDSMNMTLSDSDNGEAGVDDSNVGTPADYEGQNSADDEKTVVQRPPRIRVRPVPGHKRTRSGDGAAAQIATGGIDWKGMEQDKIPLPVEEADDDEEQPLVSGDRLQRYNWFASAPGNESSSGTLGSASFGSSNPLPNTGLPPIPGQNHKRPFWPSPGATGKEGIDSRQAWMQQAAQLQSSGSLNSHGSLHSLEETPEEYSEGGGSSTGTEDDDYNNGDDDDNMPGTVPQNRVSVRKSIQDAEKVEQIFQEGLRSGGSGQAHLYRSSSPLANIGKESASKASRAAFLPTSYQDDEPGYPTFICPRCNTRQREFFTVENASGKFGGPGAYLALYFFLYVICSLFIFGLEEGWMPLDCIYFAVITLTTTGLGDFVPTSDANKMICSMFIYFGVACIGLLLGSYIAGMMDDRAIREQKENQMDSCPNCARIRALQESAEHNAGIRSGSFAPGFNDFGGATKPHLHRYASERFASGADLLGRAALYCPVNHNHHHRQDDHGPASTNGSGQKSSKNRACAEPPPPPPPLAPPSYMAVYSDGNTRGAISSYKPENSPAASTVSGSPSLGSAVTRNILGRQHHTRHNSFEIGTNMSLLSGGTPTTYGAADVRVRNFSEDYRAVSTNPLGEIPSSRKLRRIQSGASLGDDVSDYNDDVDEDEEGSVGEDSESSLYSSDSGSSVEGLWDTTKNKIQIAKYIFLTLRLALFNSMVIIAVGCIGFWLIEGFTLIDGWYFTTVLLTTVGYGDIVPITKGGKLFATVYVLVAGTILLNNMSTISMIPLELRRRRIERAILTQFGDHLDDAALRELATGPVIQRLNLSANRADGLDECTREMFALAMLVRLGKVTERDIRETFAAFRHLDVNNDGVLNSKSIIAGMIARQRSRAILLAQSANSNNHTATPSPAHSTPTTPGHRRSFSNS